jgi:hypothetical protein
MEHNNLDKLKYILDKSNINHMTEIMKLSNLKDVHIYSKINELPGSIYGSLIENYIRINYNMTKNKPSSCCGDLHNSNKNYEIKVSIGGKNNNKFNYVQLRLNHNCEYILTAYYIDNNNLLNSGELFIFKLNKNEIKNMILKYGSYAHGTTQKLGEITKKDLDNKQNNKEYVIRPTYQDKCWNELLNFRIDEFSI